MNEECNTNMDKNKNKTFLIPVLLRFILNMITHLNWTHLFAHQTRSERHFPMCIFPRYIPLCDYPNHPLFLFWLQQSLNKWTEINSDWKPQQPQKMACVSGVLSGCSSLCFRYKLNITAFHCLYCIYCALEDKGQKGRWESAKVYKTQKSNLILLTHITFGAIPLVLLSLHVYLH